MIDGDVLAFDIETVPDVQAARRLFGARDLDDAACGELLFQRRRQATGNDFLPHYLQRICAISAVLRRGRKLSIWSLGDPDTEEPELVRRFFEGIDRFLPTLVTWNGSGFDLPVLHYRALLHGISAGSYWNVGSDGGEFRFNNYLGRFHWRHIDLMDVLAGYQPRAGAPLDEVAMLCGFPGKLGMSGARVWDAFLAGDIAGIRDYCETDALNTYLLYLRFELMRGRIEAREYQAECSAVREHLHEDGRPHLREFLDAWPEGEPSGTSPVAEGAP